MYAPVVEDGRELFSPYINNGLFDDKCFIATMTENDYRATVPRRLTFFKGSGVLDELKRNMGLLASYDRRHDQGRLDGLYGTVRSKQVFTTVSADLTNRHNESGVVSVAGFIPWPDVENI